uniref:Agrin-like n=1 Tax=Phallusia mammillata TaxID=59560 RepID=A0A6F9D6T4_9ASCI|nr:agrin-like [Phallusia mammillata]
MCTNKLNICIGLTVHIFLLLNINSGMLLRETNNAMSTTVALVAVALILSGQCVRSGEEMSAYFDGSLGCASDPSMPVTSFDADKPCDQSLNCRHGGICWRSEDNDTTATRRRHASRMGVETCRCTMHCDSHPVRSPSDPELSYVCGSDGSTYRTECHLRLAACRCQTAITVQWSGSCEKGPRSPPRDLPGIPPRYGSGDGGSVDDVCVEGETCLYGAVCDADAEDGPCLCKHDCQGTRPYTVCGTDQQSYYNECYLTEAACQDQKGIKLEHVGACQDQPKDLALPGPGVLDRVLYGSGSDTDDTEVSESPRNPCEYIFCLHGACRPIGNDDFECSCDAVCDEAAYALQQNTLSRFGKSSLQEVYKIMPELQSRLYEDEQMNLLDPSDEPTTTTVATTTRNPNTRRRLPQRTPKTDKIFRIQIDYIGLDKAHFGRNRNPRPQADWTKTNRRGQRQRSRPKRRRSRRGRNRRHKRSALFSPPRRLNLISDVVCGSDGKTYKDECQMKVHACYEKTTIKVRKVGVCPLLYKFTDPNRNLSTTAKPSTTSSPTVTPSVFSYVTLSTKGKVVLSSKTTVSPTTEAKENMDVSSIWAIENQPQAMKEPSKSPNPLQNTSTRKKTTTTTTAVASKPVPKTSNNSVDRPSVLETLRKPWVIVLAGVLQVTLLVLVGSFLYRKFVRHLRNNKDKNNSDDKSPSTEESVAFKSSNANSEA